MEASLPGYCADVRIWAKPDFHTYWYWALNRNQTWIQLEHSRKVWHTLIMEPSLPEYCVDVRNWAELDFHTYWYWTLNRTQTWIELEQKR